MITKFSTLGAPVPVRKWGKRRGAKGGKEKGREETWEGQRMMRKGMEGKDRERGRMGREEGKGREGKVKGK